MRESVTNVIWNEPKKEVQCKAAEMLIKITKSKLSVVVNKWGEILEVLTTLLLGDETEEEED